MEEYVYNPLTVNGTVFLMWLMLKYYLQFLAGHFVMQMRKIPEVKLFAYPSAIKPFMSTACMPHFVHMIVILLVQGSQEQHTLQLT